MRQDLSEARSICGWFRLTRNAWHGRLWLGSDCWRDKMTLELTRHKGSSFADMAARVDLTCKPMWQGVWFAGVAHCLLASLTCLYDLVVHVIDSDWLTGFAYAGLLVQCGPAQLDPFELTRSDSSRLSMRSDQFWPNLALMMSHSIQVGFCHGSSWNWTGPLARHAPGHATLAIHTPRAQHAQSLHTPIIIRNTVALGGAWGHV